MRLLAIVMSLQLVASIKYKQKLSAQLSKLESELNADLAQADDEPECNGCKYAYITMLLSESGLPSGMLKDKLFKLKASESSGVGLVEDMPDLMLNGEMESEAENSESDLIQFTNHLSGKEAVVELARNLASVGAKYPLIIITDKESGLLQDQKELNLEKIYPNIEVVEFQTYLWPSPQFSMPKDKSLSSFKQDILRFQKLNTLGMDHYDKLMWLDLDVRVRKNLDSVFQLNTGSNMYFMKDDWYCNGKLINGGYSSGLMLFKPRKALFEQAVQVANDSKDVVDDAIIMQRAFMSEKAPIDITMQWLPDGTIRYPQCDKKGDIEQASAVHFQKVKHGVEMPSGGPDEASKSDM